MTWWCLLGRPADTEVEAGDKTPPWTMVVRLSPHTHFYTSHTSAATDMASLNPKPGALAWLWLCLPGAITVGAALALVLVAVTFSLIRPRTRNDVPELWDSIPRVANTFQYMTDTNKFLARAA